jgi:hypothetical protein
VQWGAWAGVGMAVDSGVVEQLEAQGMGAVREEQGLCALELAMSGAAASGVVGMVPLVWPVLLGLMGGEVPLFLGGFKDRAGQQLAGQSVLSCAIAIEATGFVASVVGEKDERAMYQAVEAMVLRQVQEAAGVSVGAHAALMESGVDSLASTELMNSLQRELGTSVKLPSTLVSSICLAFFGC